MKMSTELIRKYECVRWTSEESEQFESALLEHGKDYQLIKKELPTKSIEQIRKHALHLLYTIRKNPQHKYAHLRQLLSIQISSPDNDWTSEDDQIILNYLKVNKKVKYQTGLAKVLPTRSSSSLSNRVHRLKITLKNLTPIQEQIRQLLLKKN